MIKLVINNVQDIKDLPWKGNAYSDMPCFSAIEDYIKRPTTTYEEARAAVWMMGKHGMGEISVVSDQELDVILAEHPNGPVIKSKIGGTLLQQIRPAFDTYKNKPEFHPMIEKIKIALVKGDANSLFAGICADLKVVDGQLLLAQMQYQLGVTTWTEFEVKVRSKLV